MATTGHPGETQPEPMLSPDEREEVTCLTYFLTEINRLSRRGLIPEASRATIVAESEERREAIQARGRGRAAFENARRLAPHDPRAAVDWATRARQGDPARREAWELELGLLRTLGDGERALALCAGGSVRFPGFLSPEALQRELDACADDGLLAARAALDKGDDDAAVALCAAKLDEQPGHFDATVILAFACQRLGRLDEAVALYRALRDLQPENPTWARWVENLERRIGTGAVHAERASGRGAGKTIAPVPEPAEPRISWQAVTGEFLQDHWQKLILCLAVLLIVVSSNVWAYQILGPSLWSPVGKCVLALVYTTMFAGLGLGLAWWGAERAGRIMLFTTLIVIPANFMLAGQMKLLTEPSGSRLAVLGLDAAALFALIRVVASSLKLPRGAGFLSAALFALAAFNAAVPPGALWPWAVRFAVFLAPAFLLLASEVWLTTAFQTGDWEGRRETTYFALGLLTFAFLSGLVRTGVFAMDLAPTLYAVPVMVLAVGSVHAAGRLSRFEPDPRPGAWLRFAGLTLSGLAFALALARPQGAVYSGSTLAAALMGLGLYAALLNRERHPAYLYFGFGALFVAYFGAFYFAKDLLSAVEQAASRALGYERKLPFPFKSINGLLFSPVLAALSLHFRRAWGDDRLARHCHYLGVPFAVAACVLSGFEPKAAVICLAGYAALFALAVPVFAAPRVIYLATAALAGAVHFGSTLVPGTTLADRAFLGSLLGLAYWMTGAVLKARGTARSCLLPLDHSALGMAALAVAAAGASVVPPSPVALASASALLVVCLLVVLVNLDAPDRRLGHVAAWTGNAGLLLLALYAGNRWAGGLNPVQFACASGAAALVGTSAGSWLRRFAAEEGAAEGRAAAAFPEPLFQVALVQVALTVLLCGVQAGRLAERLATADFAAAAVALGLAAAALAMLTRPYPTVALAHLTIACGLGVWMCAFQVALGGRVASYAGYAAVASGYALLLLATEEAGRAYAGRKKTADPYFRSAVFPTVDLFARALPAFEVAVVMGAVALGAYGLTISPALIVTLAAGAAAMLWSTRLRPVSTLVDLSIGLAVAAALCTTWWRVSGPSTGVSLAWLAMTTAAAAGALWAAGRASASRPALALYVWPSFRAAVILPWFVYPLALVASVADWRAYPVSAVALGLNAAVLVLLAWTLRRPGATYRAIVSVVLGVYVVVINVGPSGPNTGYVLGLVAAALSLLFSAVGFACRAWATAENGRERLFARPLFVMALVMTVLGVAPAYDSPWTMLLVALSFLVLVKGLPSRRWLYPTVASLVCALYYGFLVDWPVDRLVTASMVVGYQLWLVALLTRRAEPALVRWLRLPQSGYDLPLFNSAAAACLVAVQLRVNETFNGAMPWSDSAGLALNLAAFVLLMIKAYPHVGWVHTSVILASTAAAMAAYPRVTSSMSWLPVGMALADVWMVAARLSGRYEPALCRRCGVPDLGYSRPVTLWSQAFFVVSTAFTAVVVTRAVLSALGGTSGPPDPSQFGPWLGVLTALALAGFYAVASGGTVERFSVVLGLEALAVLAVWWLAAPGSPLVARLGVDPRSYLPLSTAAFSALTAGLGLRLARRPGWPGGFLGTGILLSMTAAAMTRAEVVLTTPVTLLLATVAPALAALARGWVPAAYVAGTTWVASAVFAALELARRGGATSDGDAAVAVASGALAALAVLWAVAGWLRRGRKDGETVEAVTFPAWTLHLALEHVALTAALVAAVSVAASALVLDRPGRGLEMGAVGVMFGLALFCIGLIVRWGAEWLVYATQSALLGGYLYYRWAFPIPAAADAAVLTLFGYLDLGLAEVMHRIGLDRFARPTRLFALALPILPMVLTVAEGPGGDLRLFVLFAAATFYGIACYAMEWKTLGYAAAVLYNAFLWLLWGRIGWSLSDHTQFFLVPVGLSAVLFAEVNRRTLGRAAVNAIRGVGLSVIYLALALPLWQYAGLGAWLAMLLISLAGVFVGIGLRVQVFLWFGLAGFVLDVVYQLGKMGMEHSQAKFGIMLVLGILLVLFVALNEKRRIVATMREYIDAARQWE